MTDRLDRVTLEAGRPRPATPSAGRWYVVGVVMGTIFGLSIALALGWSP